MQSYDVIVVGAGFGGPVAAKKCADAGLRTLIVERARRPGEKVISGTYIGTDAFLLGPSWIREGNPPLERASYGVKLNFIKSGEIYISLKVSFPYPVAYGAYCRPVCTWLAEQAVKAGAELKTSTTAVDVIKERGYIKGIITDGGEELRSKVIIDSEGLQNLLAIKAGIRRKYVPETIELCIEYDFEMASDDLENIFENHIELNFAMPDEKLVAPLAKARRFISSPTGTAFTPVLASS